LRHGNFARLGLVQGPLELIVELALGREQRNFPHARRNVGASAQIVDDRAQMRVGAAAVEADASGPAQPRDIVATRGTVVGGLAGFVELVTPEQRQAKARVRVDVGGHGRVLMVRYYKDGLSESETHRAT